MDFRNRHQQFFTKRVAHSQSVYILRPEVSQKIRFESKIRIAFEYFLFSKNRLSNPRSQIDLLIF